MATRTIKPPRICVLTQTASELPAYYREFFQGFDLFFITFKQENPDALAFLPQSTMHEGRNYMWEHVKGKYDYYLFIDDDQVFYEWRPYLPLAMETIWKRLQPKIRFARFVPALAKLKYADVTKRMYRPLTPARFKALLFKKIKTYQPLLASFRTLATPAVFALDEYALRRNRSVRRLGWFDAQVTLLSEVGADLLLPYIPGWWSPQVPIYCLSYLAFKQQAIYILDMAASNENHFNYRTDFDGRTEVLEVANWLSKGILDKDCGPLYSAPLDFIDFEFASETIKQKVVIDKFQHPNLKAILADLGKSFDLHHPYIYDRHKEIVDALDAKMNGRMTDKVHD